MALAIANDLKLMSEDHHDHSSHHHHHHHHKLIPSSSLDQTSSSPNGSKRCQSLSSSSSLSSPKRVEISQHQKNLRQKNRLIIEQNFLIKQFRRRSRWKLFLIWLLVIGIGLVFFLLIILPLSEQIHSEDYHRFFTILILSLIVICALIMICTNLIRKIKSRWNRKSANFSSSLTSSSPHHSVSR
ncbi:hypothetical protein SSS_03561 [Sarcoptes scabiei]|uniref:Uncharacterized protein n=1 Tax=Sarcoptes scabiei TaxID=52283 RepID=A0A834R265_SARSC|nr:hypothetical protein SSS_03561 [Sarcoptes scabiei]